MGVPCCNLCPTLYFTWHTRHDVVYIWNRLTHYSLLNEINQLCIDSPHYRPCNAERWCFLCFSKNKLLNIFLPVMLDEMNLIWRHHNGSSVYIVMSVDTFDMWASEAVISYMFGKYSNAIDYAHTQYFRGYEYAWYKWLWPLIFKEWLLPTLHPWQCGATSSTTQCYAYIYIWIYAAN